MKTLPTCPRHALAAILPILTIIAAMLAHTTTAQAQYYYQPGYGYYYPQQQQPPQRQPQYQQRRPSQYPPQPAQSKPRRSQPDHSAEKPPTADISTITGPLQSYTFDYKDTLSDLAKATGISTNQILALNHLTVSQLRDGQVLQVPTINPDADSDLDIKASPTDQAAREVWRGIRGDKRIALTFDAGGEPDGGQAILDHLTEAKAPATFFVTGEFAKKHPDLLNKWARAGHPIHNHSWSHPDFTELSDDEILTQLSRADDAISSVTGKSTKPYWRPPFGARDSRVLHLTAEAGYTSIYWTLDTLDSVNDKKSAEFILDRIVNPPKAKANPQAWLDGGIILMHVGETTTADAVPQIINTLRKQGFTLVTVDEILHPIKKPNP